MAVITCATGKTCHNWFWMNDFFSNAYQLQRRVMLLSPCTLVWGDNAAWLPEHSLLLVAGVCPEGHEPQRAGAAGSWLAPGPAIGAGCCMLFLTLSWA